jgi:hypothetical protein
MPAQVWHQHAKAICREMLGIGGKLGATGRQSVAQDNGRPGAAIGIVQQDAVRRAVALVLQAPFLRQALPIRMPAAKTSDPPSTTCNTARQNGVCM